MANRSNVVRLTANEKALIEMLREYDRDFVFHVRLALTSEVRDLVYDSNDLDSAEKVKNFAKLFADISEEAR